MSAGETPATKRRYLKTHNAMRGIAALAVFLYHIQLEPAYRLPLGWAEPIVSRGYLWVDFFFILSGYVLSLNYLRPLGERRPGALGGFIAARIARILPMHLFALAVLVALATGFNAESKLVGHAPFWQFLSDPNYAYLGLQAALLQIWNYRASLSWNIPSWSISAEMHVYLLLPIIAIALRHKPRVACGLLLALSGAIYLFILVDRPRLDILDPLALLRCLAGFSLGVCLERMEPLCAKISERMASTAQAFLLVAIPAILVSPLHDVCIIPIFALLVAVTATDRGFLARLLGSKQPQVLGHISYSLYLLNFPVLMAADLIWPKLDPVLTGIPELAKRVIWIALLLLAILTAARATFRWIEGPLRSRTRALLGASARKGARRADTDSPAAPPFPVSEPAP